MPKGHTHLVRSALKLVPLTKHLPIAKIKEVMFTYILLVLNGSGSGHDFFNARKAAKPRKKTSKRKKGVSQPVDMAVDTPPPSNPSVGVILLISVIPFICGARATSLCCSGWQDNAPESPSLFRRVVA
jgi:hypothetical protein